VEAIERGDRRPLEMIVQPGAHDDVVLGVLPQHDPRALLMPLPPRSPGGPYRHLQIGEARVRPGTGVDGPPPRGEGPGPLHLGAPPRDDDEARGAELLAPPLRADGALVEIAGLAGEAVFQTHHMPLRDRGDPDADVFWHGDVPR